MSGRRSDTVTKSTTPSSSAARASSPLPQLTTVASGSSLSRHLLDQPTHDLGAVDHHDPRLGAGNVSADVALHAVPVLLGSGHPGRLSWRAQTMRAPSQPSSAATTGTRASCQPAGRRNPVARRSSRPGATPVRPAPIPTEASAPWPPARRPDRTRDRHKGRAGARRTGWRRPAAAPRSRRTRPWISRRTLLPTTSSAASASSAASISTARVPTASSASRRWRQAPSSCTWSTPCWARSHVQQYRGPRRRPDAWPGAPPAPRAAGCSPAP